MALTLAFFLPCSATGLFHGSEAAGRGEGEPVRAAAVRQQRVQPTKGRAEDAATARHSETSQGKHLSLETLIKGVG